eukprot:5588537-Prorocentrum_lima.AAC.1
MGLHPLYWRVILAAHQHGRIQKDKQLCGHPASKGYVEDLPQALAKLHNPGGKGQGKGRYSSSRVAA